MDPAEEPNPNNEAVQAQAKIVVAGVLGLVLPRSVFRRLQARRVQRDVDAYDSVERGRRLLNVAVNLGEKPDSKRHGAIVDRHLAIESSSWMTLGHGLFTRRSLTPAVVEGADHLLDALAAGNGVVIWRMNFAMPGPLNRALADLGHPAVHLSEDIHMRVEGSKLSGQVLAPLLIRNEARHLAERVMFSRDSGGLGYLKHLKRRLGENRVVTIVGDSRKGKMMLPTTVLGKPWRVPTGAASLAHSTGAALLTALVIAEPGEPDRVIIQEPIDVDRSDRRTFRQEAVHEFGRRLDASIRAHPENRPSISLRLNAQRA